MNNIMLDLETMGNSSNAAIIAIGAVRFDKEVTEKFYEKVDLGSSLKCGLEIDSDTVLWWMKQGGDARKQFEGDVRKQFLPLRYALLMFAGWIGDDAIMWGNGAAFDNAIMANAYRACELIQPWKFWNDRCYRTIKNLHPEIKMERTGIHHCAVDDAESQALHLMRILAC